MKTKIIPCLFLVFATAVAQADPLGTAFTYQGQLSASGVAASGSYDFIFTLYTNSTTGSQINLFPSVGLPVTNGLFIASIDFGNVFTNDIAYWLGISVRTNNGGSYTPLNPRQPLTPTPYAIFANTASNLTGILPTTQLTGAFPASQLSGTVNNNQLANNSITVNAGSGLSGGGPVSLGSSTTLNLANSSITVNAGSGLSGGGPVSLGSSTTLNLANSSITVTPGTGLSGGGTVALGNSITLNNSGVTSIAGGGGVTVSAQSGSVTLGSTATSADNANDIVSRDSSGNFSAGSITLSGSMILQNGNANTPVGFNVLPNATGTENTGSGQYALNKDTSGSDNTGFGAYSLYSNTAGNNNVAVGYDAGYGMTGNNNIAVGYEAGFSSTPGSANIDIGNQGQSGDNGVIRIGAQGTQSVAFIAGISGATAASGVAVYVNSSGQLGTLTSSARFKTDIHNMGDASDVLLALKPVSFKYKPSIDPEGIPQFGLVAEQVAKVDPDLVAHDAKGNIYTVRYQAVDAMLLNEFLKEHKTVQEQSTEIQTLEQQNDSLAKRLNDLEAMIKQIATQK